MFIIIHIFVKGDRYVPSCSEVNTGITGKTQKFVMLQVNVYKFPLFATKSYWCSTSMLINKVKYMDLKYIKQLMMYSHKYVI